LELIEIFFYFLLYFKERTKKYRLRREISGKKMIIISLKNKIALRNFTLNPDDKT